MSASEAPLFPKLAIVLWLADQSRPELCGTPFSIAASAAAMQAEVEIYFSAGSVNLLRPGVAAELVPGARLGETTHAVRVEGQMEASASNMDKPETFSVATFMALARREGARFYACSAALMAADMSPESIASEIDAVVGAGAMSQRILAPEWKVLVF